jgi:hypothetical protein
MRLTDVPELDVARVVAAFERRVRALNPDDHDLAVRTLHRLTPANWTLEWFLPWWLGHAFGLDSRVSLKIVLSNVLGLVSIRLQDDLADGDVAAEDVAAADRLSTVLFDGALVVSRNQFPAVSPFWTRLDEWMAGWRRASAVDGVHADDLASRGAPLKIGAYATCLLADRVDKWDLVERCLDRALTAFVLYDQVCDWEADVAAGRWNAFVASISGDGQGRFDRDRTRATVLAAMLTRGVVTAHFQRTHAEAIHAARLAIKLGSPPLAAHLSEYAVRTAEQGAMMEAHYRTAADRAATLMFGTSPPGGRT